MSGELDQGGAGVERLEAGLCFSEFREELTYIINGLIQYGNNSLKRNNIRDETLMVSSTGSVKVSRSHSLHCSDTARNELEFEDFLRQPQFNNLPNSSQSPSHALTLLRHFHSHPHHIRVLRVPLPKTEMNSDFPRSGSNTITLQRFARLTECMRKLSACISQRASLCMYGLSNRLGSVYPVSYNTPE